MSIEAQRYLKKLNLTVFAPNGERVTCVEKALLWELADYHNLIPPSRAVVKGSTTEMAAWCSVELLADALNLSPRRVREILAGLIDKGILWRDPRVRLRKEEKTNYWKFTSLDGEAPNEVKIMEQVTRQRGELIAARSQKVKAVKAAGNPQIGCESDCEMPHRDNAESRIGGCEIPQGVGAESRIGGCEIPQGVGAESRIGDCEISQSNTQRTTTELSGNAVVELPVENSLEHSVGAACGNSSGKWSQMLALVTDQMAPALRARLACDAREVACFVGDLATEIVVSVPNRDFVLVFSELNGEFTTAAELLHIVPPVRLVFVAQNQVRAQ